MMQQQKLEKLKQDQQAGRTFLGKAKKKAVVKSNSGRLRARMASLHQRVGRRREGGRVSSAVCLAVGRLSPIVTRRIILSPSPQQQPSRRCRRHCL